MELISFVLYIYKYNQATACWKNFILNKHLKQQLYFQGTQNANKNQTNNNIIESLVATDSHDRNNEFKALATLLNVKQSLAFHEGSQHSIKIIFSQ